MSYTHLTERERISIQFCQGMVHQAELARRLIESGTNMVADAFSDPQQIDDVLDNAEKMIFDIAMRHSREGFHKIDVFIKRVHDKIDSLYDKKEAITGSRISPEPYIRYLTQKYSEIYGL